MQPDSEGFLYPRVNATLCIGCGSCRVVCPYHYNFVPSSFRQKIYAVKHRDEEIRAKSTSGGLFTAISDYILENGGVVYGSAFDGNLSVCHIRAQDFEERDRMRGSKYVQSEIGYLFQAIKKDLSEGRRVLFTGTPCQCAGLSRYLGKEDKENLLLCDIICHGVPSGLLWEDYKSFVSHKRRQTLKIHYFRTKLNGWHSMTSRNIFENGTQDYGSCLSQIHMNLFLKNYTLRPCCYFCRFSSRLRYSDITLGDYWGIEQVMPEFDDNKGISQAMINTVKGEELFRAIRDRLLVEEINTTGSSQHNLQLPSIYPENREDFWRDYKRKGYPYVARKYAGYNLVGKLRQLILRLLKRLGLDEYIRKLLRSHK